jgi:Secretion system C-terminal sorting domain
MKTVILSCCMFLTLQQSYAQIDSFVVVGTHPQAAVQPSSIGKFIATLQAWNGILYSGYGDYGANTGPISITSFNPVTKVFTEEFSANTEAIYNFRPIGNRLYAPSIDIKSYAQPGDYFVLDSIGTWTAVNCGATTHAYDMASLGGSDLWVVGSKGYAAAVWRSSDYGASWQLNRLDSIAVDTTGNFARYYFCAAYMGKLYVQARDYRTPLHPKSKVFDGNEWNDGPDFFPNSHKSLGWKPEEFAGKLVYRSWSPPNTVSKLWVYDGNYADWLDMMYVYDICIDGEYLYALYHNGFDAAHVRRTLDLQDWEIIAEAPVNSRSIALVNDKIYLGTTTSEILESAGSLPTSLPHIALASEMILTVYPNPAKGQINIQLNGKHSLEGTIIIRNVLGEIVSEVHVDHLSNSNHLSLNVTGLTVGLYYISYRSGNSYTNTVFIRQ